MLALCLVPFPAGLARFLRTNETRAIGDIEQTMNEFGADGKSRDWQSVL